MTNHTITKTFFQATTPTPPRSQCAMCGQIVTEGEGTAGPYTADGELTLICGAHLRDSRQFINLLADYRATERQRYLQHKLAGNNGVVPDAWFLY